MKTAIAALSLFAFLAASSIPPVYAQTGGGTTDTTGKPAKPKKTRAHKTAPAKKTTAKKSKSKKGKKPPSTSGSGTTNQ